MQKEDILIIGAGGCGNRQLDILLGLDLRYSGLYLNTNLHEMESLKHFNRDRRCFHISNADGTGKDIEKMKGFAKDEAPKFTVISKNYTQRYIIFLTSANGGTGSQTTLMYSKLMKKLYPEKSINVVATFPSLNETEIDYQNASHFWNEINILKKNGVVDSIMYIDNNKANESDVNFRAMSELDESFNIINGRLDSSDSRKVHSTSGYKVFLKLNSSTVDTAKAIEEAKKSTMFFTPDSFKCDKMLVDLNIENFEMSLVKKSFECYNFNKDNEKKEGDSFILLGGCAMPKETIELVKEALEEIESKKKRRIVEDDIIVNFKSDNKSNPSMNKENSLITNGRTTSNDLNKLFSDDSFWDD